MRRREFITLLGGTAAGWPIAVHAQQPERMRRIGVLMAFSENDSATKERLAAFRQGLEKRGWFDGRNIHLHYRFTADRAQQFQALAKELLALQPEVILASTTGITATLQRESHTIPIVFVNVSDPIGSGFIESLARPGGNITGVQHIEAGIMGKWLTMLKQIAPRLARAALLANQKTTPFDYFLQSAQAVAPSLGIELVPSDVVTATNIERALESIARLPDCGLVLPPDATTFVHRDLVIALAAKYRLPAVYPIKTFVSAGGLMSYGADQNDMYRLAGFYVDRILRGDKPAELPVQVPTKFETAINLKTAKALGLTVPPGLVVAADEVIE